MANHCEYLTCHECKTTYCARGCGDTCRCGREAEDPVERERERARIREAERRIAEDMPEGWF